MLNLKLNLKHTGIEQKAIMKYKENVEQIHKELHKRANDENDFVGWLELPTNYDKEEFERIKKAAQRIREDSEVLIVIGIGGSYLGARAVRPIARPKNVKGTTIATILNNIDEKYTAFEA